MPTQLPPRLDLLQPRSSAEPDAALLGQMVAAQRRLVESLRRDERGDCEGRAAHEATLRFLQAQLSRKLQGADSSRAHLFHDAEELADVLTFVVPGSHRGDTVGKAVTLAKRAVMQGLAPFHVELLRAQRRFNIELVASLRELAELDGEAARKFGKKAAKTLAPLANPAEWGIQSHRGKALGRLVGAAKRGYLRALSGALRNILAGQRAWNEQVVEWVDSSLEALTPVDAHEKVQELLRRADPVEAVPPRARILNPLWREVFRRQTAFNHRVISLIAGRVNTHVPGSPRSAEEYRQWCSKVEPEQIEASVQGARALTDGPRLSVIVPTYQTPEPLLRACLDSVLQQGYPNVELCIADDGSTSRKLAALLDQYARKDKRVKLTRLESNRGIAAATNAALALATGDYVCFLDHDDELAPHALSEVANTLAGHPETDVAYSDEDHLNEQGQRIRPFFKPEWSPDLLRAVNYVCHFLVVRRSLATEVGGIRLGFDGAQDYDFILRLSERTQWIRRIPRVLYHWRMTPQSTSGDVRNKPTAGAAGVRALREHLARSGPEGATVEEYQPTNYRVRYPLRGQPLVSIMVPFKDKPALLRTLVTSLLEKTTYPHFELLLVSNNSTDPETFALLDSFTDPRIRKLVYDEPFNYSAINNHAVRFAKGEIFCFLNNDIEITQADWLEELISQAQRPEIGAVGPKLRFPDRTLQHVGVVLGIQGFAGHVFTGQSDQAETPSFGSPNWPRNYLAVTGACLVMRREVFQAVNGFDESFIVCGSDVDLGLKIIRHGLRVLYTPFAEMIHDESSTRRTDSIPEGDFWRSFSSYGPYLKGGDPYYNPNLSLTGTDFGLRTDSQTAGSMALEWLSTRLPGSHLSSEEQGRIDSLLHLSAHLRALDYSSQQADEFRAKGKRGLAAVRQRGKVASITWLLPYFRHPYGGVHTILRFGQLLQARHDVRTRFVIYDDPTASVRELEAKAAALFPDLKGAFHVRRGVGADEEALVDCDVAVATFWTAAYHLMNYPKAELGAYFVQDYEPLFYPAGTFYGLAEQTYRLGLYGIFNTQGLHDFVTSNYPMQGTWFEPTVERSVFHAGRPERKGPIRVFFYARPSTARNAFELGLASLLQLKREFGKRVEIVTAGEAWNPEAYGARGAIQNLGILSYEQTGDLYRSCDVGVSFMFTKHPSYLPMEMMACGVTVVTNDNPANGWLLEHDRNCLVAEPTPECVLEQLRRAVESADLRSRIGKAAALRMTRTTWEEQVDRVYHGLVDAKARRISA